MFKKSVALLAGMLVTFAVFAADAQLRQNHPDTYTVRHGDTLWGISAKFLSKPWLWPEIWQANPQVSNPHLIYPGDMLNLSFINGARVKLEPSIHREGDAVPAIALSQLRMFLKDRRVLNAEQVKRLPYVVGFEEGRLRGTVGQNIYARRLNAQPGQRWAVVRPSHVFRSFADEGDRRSDGSDGIVAHQLDSNVAMVSTPWSEDFRNDGHYGRGHTLGVEVSVIGEVETLRSGDPSTLLLLNSTEEVRSGDRLMPMDESPYDPYYFPHAPKSMPAGAHVVALADAMHSAGPRQVVALSVGARDGIDNGTTFAMWKPGEVIADDVASNSWNRGVGETVKLPEEFVGHVMVFRTFDRVSYGLFMDGLKPANIGDTLRAPE